MPALPTQILVTNGVPKKLGDVLSDATTKANAAVSSTQFAAPGDLVVGTGAGTVATLSIGADNEVLAADSTQPLGVVWKPVPNVFANGITADSLTALTTALTLKGAMPDSASAVGAIIDTPGAYTAGTGARLLSVRSAGAEKFYIDPAGSIVVGATGAANVFANTYLS